MMFSRKTLAKGVCAVGAVATLAGAAVVPTTASAQSYYDECARDSAQRGVVGGLAGATGGAIIGSQLSARGRHTENSLIGGVVGAIAGAAIGRSTSGCRPAAYYDSGYDNRYYDNRAYDDRAYYAAPPPAPVYVAPPPVYVAPAPVIIAPRPYYYPRYYYGRGHGRWRGW